MGEVKKHPPVKLIAGIIAASEDIIPSVESALAQEFSPIDFQSGIMPFDYTDYYTKEMGSGLLRKFITFEKLIQPEEIVEIKLSTNKLEGKFLHPDTLRRRVNIDPGYVSAAKLILVSTKDHIHRVYLREGIYAETTLRMENKSFRAWEWTYPDYRSEAYIDIFNGIRERYMQQLRESGISAHPL